MSVFCYKIELVKSRDARLRCNVFLQLTDAEMTIKVLFKRLSQKGGRQGVRKEGQHGIHLEILLSAKSTGNTAFWKVAFLLSSLFPRKYSDNNLDNNPPSTLQGVGPGGRKNPRIIVRENSSHFGAS